MTGRERIESAFSAEGTRDFAAFISYQSILVRDHWDEITDSPWWDFYALDPAVAARPWLDMLHRTDAECLKLPSGYSREDQRRYRIDVTPDGVFRVDGQTKKKQELQRMVAGGIPTRTPGKWTPPALGVTDIDVLDKILSTIYLTLSPSLAPPLDDGRLDLPRSLVGMVGQEIFPYSHVSTPLSACYSLWGFDGLMLALIESPELIEHAVKRILEDQIIQIQRMAMTGAAAIWIEDPFTDMVSPAYYRRFNLPQLRAMTDVARANGLFSIHYYCGNPNTRWDELLDTGADALALEESKKDFTVDIDDVVDRVHGRMTVFGNMDAISVLEQGSEEILRDEIRRQCRAGRRNQSRFVMSLGSPVTPNTSIERIQRYCEFVHETE